MKNMKKIKKVVTMKLVNFTALVFVIALSLSCNKDFPNTLRTEYPNDTLNIKEANRKVLMIIVDGLRGEAVAELATNNLTSLLKNSVFTYNAIADRSDKTLTASMGWSNLLTGVYNDKHMVLGETFAGNNITAFPSIFTRLKAERQSIRSASIVASPAINEYLAVDATHKIALNANDIGVKDAVLDELKRPDAGFVLAQFASAEIAGKSGGFDINNSNYTNSIIQIDDHIGKILTAMKARASYAKEDWLVVVVSSKGGFVAPVPGTQNEGLFSDGTRNAFALFYNPRLTRQELIKPDINSIPFSGNAPILVGNNASRNTLTGSTDVANFGTGTGGGEFTIMLKVRTNHGSITGFSPFIGKTANFAQNNSGWVLFTSGDNWNFKANGTQQFQRGSRFIRDGIWHSIALRIFNENGNRWVKAYQDGKLVGGPSSNAVDVGVYGSPFTVNMSSATPFTVGNIFTSESSPSAINMLMREVAIYNTAIPEATLVEYMRKTTVLSTDPYYGNLIGYWPLDENSGGIANEKSGNSSPLTFTNPQYSSFLDLSPHLSPPISDAAYEVVLNSADVPMQLFYWLGVLPKDTWQLSGNFRKFLYTDVR